MFGARMLRKLLIALLLCSALQPVMPAFSQTESPPVETGALPLSLTTLGTLPSLDMASLLGPDRDPATRAQLTRLADFSKWSAHQLQPGEALSCLAARSGMTLDYVARANQILNPAVLVPGQALNLPPSESEAVISAHRYDTPMHLAIKNRLPLWDVLRRNPGPLYEGARIVLPGDMPDVCFPYPLLGLELSPHPVTRGNTAMLVLETAEPASCEVTYLDQTEPCYVADDTHLYAFIGLSALMEPGEYEVRILLESDGLQMAMVLPLVVEAGRYGYQFINPPASLNKLMDPAVMQGELDYLKPWQAVRTPARSWEFPLAFPLSRSVSVSADYGDRRSYGGLVDGYHSGVDYRAWTGLPVLAPADGVILMAEKLTARGNAILIDHGWGLVTGYWHLSRIEVEVGQHVKRGDTIGKVGNTGLSTGSHLHWEMWVNGVSVDGKQWLAADAFGDLRLPELEQEVMYSTVTDEQDPQ